MPPADIRIETRRLLLRLPQTGDFERYAELFADGEASRHIGGQLARGAAWRRFLQMPGAWMLQGFAMFSVVEKETGLWIGQAGPWRPDGWPGKEIGYAFHPQAWGKGYAVEAVAATIDWAFANLGWEDIIHCISPANVASKKVAQRLGSRLLREGCVLPPPADGHQVEVWGQSRRQWLENRERLPW